MTLSIVHKFVCYYERWTNLICRNIMEDTVGGHASSYIAGVMRPVYNHCMQQSGMLYLSSSIQSHFLLVLMQTGLHRNGE